MNTSPSSLPPANCRICGSSVRAVKFSTFSYWYCDRCKDEVEVWLRTVGTPKGEVLYALTQNSDINIDKPGLYSIHYCDGTHEWYEHTAHKRPIRLSGATVRSASRTPDSDLPSRKPVQSPSKAGQGTADEGFRLRTVSNAPNSSAGTDPNQIAKSFGGTRPDNHIRYFGSQLWIKSWTYDVNTDRYKIETHSGQWFYENSEDLEHLLKSFDGSISGVSLSPGTIVPLQNLGPSGLGVQHGSLPPDDEI